jgi:hypothetical protein
MNDEQLKTLVECDQRSKSNTHRLDKLEEQWEVLNKLAVSVEKMGINLATMDKTIQKLDAKVEEQEAKPGKRWEALVEKVVFLFVGAVAAYVFARIGL